MRFVNLGFEKFKPLQDYFGLLTFLTIAFGYIGFYTYSAKYSLPFVSPSISLIIGLGILSILLILTFYLVSGGQFKRLDSTIQAAILVFIFASVLHNLNPLYLFLILYIYVDNDSFTFSSSTRNFREKRKLIYRIYKRGRICRYIITIANIVIGLFVNFKITVIFFFVLGAIRTFRYMRINVVKPMAFFLICLLTPIFLFGFLIEDFDFTLFGLSRSPIIVQRKDSSISKEILIFRDGDMYYFEDSINKKSNIIFNTIHKSHAVSKDEIVLFRTDTTTKSKIEMKGLLELIKGMKNDEKNR